MSGPATVGFPDFMSAARALAQDFLQSVVVVDDRAAFAGEDVAKVTDLPALPEEPSIRGRKGRIIIGLKEPDGTGSQLVPEQALDAKIIVDGFAARGLVCAVIKPNSTESPVDLTVAVAKRADIVILDWEMNGDDGASTLEIVMRIVNEEAEVAPHGRLRLIAIYSGVLNLRQIATRLRDTLKGKKGAPAFKRDGHFAIVAGAVRISVFAKQTSRLLHADKALRARVVSGADLPDRLVTEFARLTIGLVPHVALASLAALRKNMHRVLGRLGAELDPGYLWHRAVQANPADAEQHLVDLVSSELRSVLEDERVGRWADLSSIAHWLSYSKGIEFRAAFGAATALSSSDVLLLLEKGAAGKRPRNQDVRDKFPAMSVERKAHREDIAAFAPTARAAKRANESLAALMSLRTRYQHPTPRLELGTIVTRGRGARCTYWLCVQPRCDSIRLEGDTAFPLLPLKTVVGNVKFDILLPKDRGRYIRLKLAKKPSEIDMPIFPVNPAASDSVVAVSIGGRFAFRAHSRRTYFWVAELKPDYAQRIAQQVANEFSRIGLTESEWLRLWSAKG